MINLSLMVMWIILPAHYRTLPVLDESYYVSKKWWFVAPWSNAYRKICCWLGYKQNLHRENQSCVKLQASQYLVLNFILCSRKCEKKQITHFLERDKDHLKPVWERLSTCWEARTASRTLIILSFYFFHATHSFLIQINISLSDTFTGVTECCGTLRKGVCSAPALSHFIFQSLCLCKVTLCLGTLGMLQSLSQTDFLSFHNLCHGGLKLSVTASARKPPEAVSPIGFCQGLCSVLNIPQDLLSHEKSISL